MFKCPYCSYKSNKSWRSVAYHIGKCVFNTNEYYVSDLYGPIHYTEYLSLSLDQFKNKYPKLAHNDGLKKFKNNGLIPVNFDFAKILWSNEEIIKAIQDFVDVTGKIPGIRDFGSNNPKYPNHDTVKVRFKTWNNAIKAAGFEPNISDFGVSTKGLDGHIYRSKAEAYFADSYLWNKYEYIIEPKYPNSNWRYDWYIPSLDLYIELDGEIRPERTKEKIELNKLLGRNCKFVKTKDMYKKEFAGIAQW